MRGATVIPVLLAASFALTATACSKKNMITGPDAAATTTGAQTTAGLASAGATPATANPNAVNGRAGAMPAYYDGELFTINFTELPAGAEPKLLTHNKGVNTIYTDDVDTVGGQPFVSVLDAIQGDGFNPLWNEIEIRFTTGHAPRQITRDDDVLAAAGAGEITLHGTAEVYRCSVIGPK